MLPRFSCKTITATSYMTSDSSKTVGGKGDQAKSSTAPRQKGRYKKHDHETVETVRRTDLKVSPQPPELSESMTTHLTPASLIQVSLQVPAHSPMVVSTQPSFVTLWSANLSPQPPVSSAFMPSHSTSTSLMQVQVSLKVSMHSTTVASTQLLCQRPDGPPSRRAT